jgi:hypothetical protein
MAKAKEPKPPPKLSDFKDLLRKLMQVPKSDVEAQEARCRERRKSAARKAG